MLAARVVAGTQSATGRLPSRPQAACVGRIWRWRCARSAIHVCTGPSAKLHSDVWQGLIDQMGEFIRKRDYRFSGETITDEETAAMETAIKVLTGMYPPVS